MAMSNALHIQHALPDDPLCRERTSLLHVAFVDSGSVDVRVRGEHIAQLGEGA